MRHYSCVVESSAAGVEVATEYWDLRLAFWRAFAGALGVRSIGLMIALGLAGSTLRHAIGVVLFGDCLFVIWAGLFPPRRGRGADRPRAARGDWSPACGLVSSRRIGTGSASFRTCRVLLGQASGSRREAVSNRTSSCSTLQARRARTRWRRLLVRNCRHALADEHTIGHYACVAGRAMLLALTLGCAVVVGAGCGGSASPRSQATEPLPTTTTTLVGMPCSFTATGCTSEQVGATLTTIFERSGATATEAPCLAALFDRGAHSMTDAFRPSSSDDTAEAVRCVGSTARLDTVVVKTEATLRQIAPQLAKLIGPQQCLSSSSETLVPISGNPGPEPSNWDNMSDEQLRKIGWRREVETSPSSCEPAP